MASGATRILAAAVKRAEPKGPRCGWCGWCGAAPTSARDLKSCGTRDTQLGQRRSELCRLREAATTLIKAEGAAKVACKCGACAPWRALNDALHWYREKEQ